MNRLRVVQVRAVQAVQLLDRNQVVVHQNHHHLHLVLIHRYHLHLVLIHRYHLHLVRIHLRLRVNQVVHRSVLIAGLQLVLHQVLILYRHHQAHQVLYQDLNLHQVLLLIVHQVLL